MPFDPHDLTDVILDGIDLAFEHWVEGEYHPAEITWLAVREEVKEVVLATVPSPTDHRALFHAIRSAITDAMAGHGLAPYDRIVSLAILFLGRLFRSITGDQRLEGAKLDILIDLSEE